MIPEVDDYILTGRKGAIIELKEFANFKDNYKLTNAALKIGES